MASNVLLMTIKSFSFGLKVSVVRSDESASLEALPESESAALAIQMAVSGVDVSECKYR